ncbi:MAG TPA: DUF3617 family protein [Thermoanaerobaculia bacterium]|nr:DUF3617 family protein [Thermoanaerobaculia bacterium]
MGHRSFLATFTVLAALAAGSASAQATAPAGPAVMVPGLWEITVQTQSPVKAAPISHTVCIDKAHVTRPDPPKSRPTDDCQVTPDASAGNETAYTVRCAKRQTTSTSRFTYSGDHFNGTVTITTAGVAVQQVYTAVRIGDCDMPDLPPAPPAH